MKNFRKATACLIMASMVCTLVPLSGCGKKKPMGTNEVLTDDSPWFDIEKTVLEKSYDPSDFDYSWSDYVGIANDHIIMHMSGSYPIPDNVNWSSVNYSDYNAELLDIYSMDGELVNTVDLIEMVNGSDVFDNIDPEELVGGNNFGISAVGSRINVAYKGEGEEEEEEDEAEDEEEASSPEEEQDITDEDDTESDEDDELIDPRDCWYSGRIDVEGDYITVDIYCYVGDGHDYVFTIDPSDGSVVSAEEVEQEVSAIDIEDGSSEGTVVVNGYSIEKFWLWGDDTSYILVVTAPDGEQTVFDLRDEIPDLSIYDIPSFIPISDTEAIFPMSISGGGGDKFGIIDLDAMTVKEYTEDTDWITVDLWGLGYLEGLGSYTMGDDGLTLLDFDNKEETVLFDYNWCNINRYDVQSLQLISYSEDELIFAGSVWQGSGSYYSFNDDSEIQILKLTRAASNPNTGKTVLVAATTGYLNYSMCEAICSFNEQNSDYYVSICNDYTMDKFVDYSDDDQDYTATYLNASSQLTDQLAIDLMAGEGPDIILDATSFYQLNNDDYLLDISDRIPAEGYFNNVFEASKIDGKMYQVPLTFAMEGIITRQSYVEDGQQGFTFDQYQEFVSDVCNGTDPMNNGTQLDFFVECLMAMNDQFIKDGRVDYDNEAFRAMAEYVKDNVVDVYEDEYAMSGAVIDYGYPEDEEECPASFDSYASFKSMIENFAKYDDVTILGIPSYDGRGPLIAVGSSAAISAQTPEPDACWSFIETLLSEDIQTLYGTSDYCTPVNLAAFENTGHDAIDDYNAYVADATRWATEADIREMGLYEIDDSCLDDFQEMIESCSQVASQDSAVITIVREEMPAYFSGQKEIDDVISVMEDRVQTFLDERG